MHIVHIASELAPIAKLGGLGDVVYGLSKELAREGHLSEVIIPKYDCIHYEFLKNLTCAIKEVKAGKYLNSVWTAELEDLKVLLIEPLHPNDYFNRGHIYGGEDETERFAYFCQAAVASLLALKKVPDVIHLHDWPTALVAGLIKEIYKKGPLAKVKIVLTIHNMQYQGPCPLTLIEDLKLKTLNFKDPHKPEMGNLLKSGIIYSDALTTVSPTYEKEIQTAEAGFGLENLAIKYKNKLNGILNGIDPEFWDPEMDPHLIAHYGQNFEKGKAANRKHLRLHLGLEDSPKPLVAAVTRLVDQKGPHLIEQAIYKTLELGGQFVLLGASGPPAINKLFQEIKEEFEGNKNIAINIDKDEALAHQIFAAADMFVIPSIFEPCGLTQMIALRYGTVPIARLTGGLADTVFDVDTSTRPLKERNGFTFEFPDKEGIDWALSRALDCWANNPEKWRTLIQNGMSQDFSWRRSVHEYLKVYSL